MSNVTKGTLPEGKGGVLISDFTGISSPYEEPLNPDLILQTDIQTENESVSSVLSLLMERGIFPGSIAIARPSPKGKVQI